MIIFLLQVTLECGAHNTGYCKPDIASSCPKGECCVEGAEDEASTCLNMDELLEQVCVWTLMVMIIHDERELRRRWAPALIGRSCLSRC